MWLFDCGEGAQRQIEQCPEVSLGDVSKIFITHMHGDHVLGLPGILQSKFATSSKQSADGSSPSMLEIYGPPGLRDFLRGVFIGTYAWGNGNANYVVHELWGWEESKSLPSKIRVSAKQRERPAAKSNSNGNGNNGETSHNKKGPSGGMRGSNIMPSVRSVDPSLPPEFFWELPMTDYDNVPTIRRFSVSAAPVVHTVPCLAYIVNEEVRTYVRTSIGWLNGGVQRACSNNNKLMYSISTVVPIPPGSFTSTHGATFLLCGCCATGQRRKYYRHP